MGNMLAYMYTILAYLYIYIYIYIYIMLFLFGVRVSCLQTLKPDKC